MIGLGSASVLNYHPIECLWTLEFIFIPTERVDIPVYNLSLCCLVYNLAVMALVVDNIGQQKSVGCMMTV